MPTALCTRWALVLALLNGGLAVAQEVASPTDISEDEAVSVAWERPVDSGEYRARAGFRYYSPNGLGYRNALMSAEGFVPILQLENSLIFGDVRTYLHDGQFGFNLGGGHRLYSGFLDKTLGVYAFFDNMNTGNRTISQASGGIDVLGNSWEARANLYYPLDRNAQVVRTPLTDSVFTGNQLLSNRLLVHETALTTIDFETGHLLYEKLNLWGFVGGYYMQGQTNPNTWGGKARVEMRVSDKFTVQFSVQHDDLFNTNAIVSAALHLPGSRPSRATNQDLAPDRLAFPVERQQNIIVAESTTVDQIMPIDPNTNAPFHVVHVASGTASGGPPGLGTFENPFDTIGEALAAAGPNSIVYVQPKAGGYSESVHLQPGQIVLGSGSKHYLTTMQGNTLLPSMTDERVIVTNAPGNAFTLADRTVVSGFDIQNAQEAAIFGEGVIDPVLVDNRITGGAHGIKLLNVTGVASVQKNAIQSTTQEAVLIQNTAGALTANVTENSISHSGGKAAVSIRTSGTADVVANVLANSLTSNFGNGVYFDARGAADLDFVAAANTIGSNNLNGIEGLITESATATFQAKSNLLSNNEYGLILQAEGDGNSTLVFSVDENLISGNRLGGTKIGVANQARMSGSVTKSIIQNNDGDGIRVFASGASQLDLRAQENTLTNNHVGISLVTDGGTSNIAALTLTQNTLTDQRSHGVSVTAGNKSTLGLTMEQNQINNSKGEGVQLLATGSANFGGQITNNQMANNHHGLLMQAQTDGTHASHLLILNNIIKANKLDAVRIDASNSANVTGGLAGNYLDQNQGSGVQLVNNDESMMTLQITNNTLNENQAPAILLISQGTELLNEMRVKVDHNTIGGTVSPGFKAETLKSGRMFLELIDNDSARGFSVSNHGESASRLHLANDSNHGGVLTEGTILPAEPGTLFP